MLDELTASTNLLCTAIERYYSACLAIQRSFARGEKPHLTTPHLPLRMDAEAQVVSLLEVKLQKAKAALNWSRNRSNTHMTVNDLPPEILARIFQIVHRTEPCAKREYNRGVKEEPMYLTILSHVCSRWREIAFSTPSLWPHLDISTSSLLNRQRLDGLVKLHLIQAGQLPLDLHVFDSSGYEPSFSYSDPASKLVTQLARRVVSFDLDIMGTFGYDVHYSVLSSFFGSCTPGKLKRLTLVQHGDDCEFLRGYDTADDEDLNNDGALAMNQTREEFEHILSRVSVLRLNQFYPQWSSRAYHGLVELRLTGSETAIAESELVHILRSSPDLRIFQFDLTIRDPLPANSQITPICLNNLEILNLATMVKSKQLDGLLRWISPGPKSLQFAVMCGFEEPGLQLKEKNTMSFFSRTRVTRAYAKYLEHFHILDLLELLPNLQVLAVRGIKPNQSDHIAGLTSERQLECFHLLHCSVHTEFISSLMNNPMLTIKTLSFYRCTFYLSGKYIPENRVASHIEELSRSHPGASLIVRDFGGPSPVESWDLFTSYQTFLGV
ncbi:hypothetical protein FRC11_007193 [Ceratobasidium sp. 423]|nr:hypothetical protein FRC11_007193 [Ceratobasidium sp. 423]